MTKSPSDLTCACGATHWTIKSQAEGRHLKCHCMDCRSFANHLGRASRHIEDDGVRIFQTYPGNVAFTKGGDNLTALRLSPKGILRWYTSCCNTPVATTIAKAGLPFCGMSLPNDHPDFGPVKTMVFTKDTDRGLKDKAVLPGILSLLARAASVRITGREYKAPFFAPDGAPTTDPSVLTLEQRKAAQP
ncbi:MAG: hypothetical protein JXQ85_06305 [Cognatishimia sp.]|uniref:DUF6151 family protein n=1 Tax=Cognatishimia sp. TaxID=2211648 RepID=UPI003B8AB1CB